jgi:hypothetical protein
VGVSCAGFEEERIADMGFVAGGSGSWSGRSGVVAFYLFDLKGRSRGATVTIFVGLTLAGVAASQSAFAQSSWPNYPNNNAISGCDIYDQVENG